LRIATAPYLDQREGWPKNGRVILAQFDGETVIVYQAYQQSIGHFAIENGFLGGSDFSLSRMTWIKPNFLWMMYRSGWGAKKGQEIVLAIRILRSAFDAILDLAVHSTFQPRLYRDREAWKEAIASSDARLQWDPDHDPMGNRLARRAIQLGLSGELIRKFAREWIVEVIDMSEFVLQQRALATAQRLSELQTPVEKVYPVSDPGVADRLGLDVFVPY
jgi:hypothetical protein